MLNNRDSSSRLVNLFSTDLGLQIKLALISIFVLLIFFQDIYIMGSEALVSDYYNYILVIPFFIAYLVYLKRKMLSAVMPLKDRGYLNQVVGFSAIALALVMYLYGSGTPNALDYHLIALQIFTGSSILLLFNRQTLKLLAVPIILVSAALPSAVNLGLSFWLGMSWASALPAFKVLKALGFPVSFTVTVDANAPTIVLSPPHGQAIPFVVGVASSGIYSVIGFALFAVFIAYISRGPLWKRVLLFVTAFPLLLAINILREIILVAVANWWGIAAFNVFHFSSGIVLVAIVTFVLLVIGERVFKIQIIPTFLRRKSCIYCEAEAHAGKAFCSNCGRFLKSFPTRIASKDVIIFIALALIALIFLASLVPAFAQTSNPTNADIRTISATSDPPATRLLPTIPGWNLTFVGRDIQTQDQLEADAVLSYLYVNDANPSFSVATNIIVSDTQHTPETSLILYARVFGTPLATQLQDGGIRILNNPIIEGTFFAYIYQGKTAANLYWTTQTGFNLGSFYDTRNIQFQLYIGDTSYLAQIGVIHNSTDFSTLKALLLPLAKDIATYWKPLGSTSTTQVVISQWATPLGLLAVLPAIAYGGNAYFTSLSRTRSAKKLLAKMSQRDKGLATIITSLQLANRGNPPTVEAIVASYKDQTKENITLEEALQGLNYAELVGIVKSGVKDVNGEPTMVWKNESSISWRKTTLWWIKSFLGSDETVRAYKQL